MERDLNDAAILNYIKNGVKTAPDMVCDYCRIDRILYGHNWKQCTYSDSELYYSMLRRTLRRCRSLERYGIIRGIRIRGTPTIWLLVNEAS